jgi:hypothetical protein
MSLKKFISGVSAFAVAATAFAAMAVTANATDYSESITLGAGNGYNIASYNSNGVATAKTGIPYAALRADLRELTDIDNASSVTVEFDAATYSGNVVVFSFGDAAQRTTIADGSGNFKTGGLAMYFGSVDGSDLKAYDKKSGQSKTLGSGFFGKILHAKVRFNKEAGTYDYELSQGSNKISQTGVATDIGNLTYVEAFTKTAGAQMMFKSITVSYTVDDEVAATGTDYEGTDGTKASLWNGTVTANAATKVIAVATLSDGVTTKSGETALDGTFTGDVEVYVVVNKAMAELSGVTLSFE